MSGSSFASVLTLVRHIIAWMRTSRCYLHSEFKAALEALYGPQPAKPPTAAPEDTKTTLPFADRNADRDARSAGIREKKLTSKWDLQAARGTPSSAIGPSGSRTPALSTRPSSRLWVLMKVEITSVNAASFTLDPETVKGLPVHQGDRQTYRIGMF